jgi:hypothetical protein
VWWFIILIQLFLEAEAGVGNTAEIAEYLPSMLKTLGSIPGTTHKPKNNNKNRTHRLLTMMQNKNCTMLRLKTSVIK